MNIQPAGQSFFFYFENDQHDNHKHVFIFFWPKNFQVYHMTHFGPIVKTSLNLYYVVEDSNQ